MNIVIRVNDEIKKKMIEYYKDKTRDKIIPYVVFQAQEEDTVITMYESGKVMFQGKSADVDAAMWGVALENTKEKKEEQGHDVDDMVKGNTSFFEDASIYDTEERETTDRDLIHELIKIGLEEDDAGE